MSASLGFSPLSTFRFIEWPVLARVIPGAAGLIFMLCVTSFTLVLIFGGGPAATTIEVAIYQALRFDFNPERAVSLALLQITVTTIEYQMVCEKVFTWTGISKVIPSRLVSTLPSKTLA